MKNVENLPLYMITFNRRLPEQKKITGKGLNDVFVI